MKWNQMQILSYPLASPFEEDAGLFETHVEKLCCLSMSKKKVKSRNCTMCTSKVLQFLGSQSERMCAFNPWPSEICVCPPAEMKSHVDYLCSFGPEKKGGA